MIRVRILGGEVDKDFDASRISLQAHIFNRKKMEVNNEITITIIKWAIIVFIAGIIGQFGKSLTLHILDWWRKRKVKVSPAKTIHPSEKPSKKLSKLEKKRQKAEIKRLKKGK